jgi:hypothetical protein
MIIPFYRKEMGGSVMIAFDQIPYSAKYRRMNIRLSTWVMW